MTNLLLRLGANALGVWVAVRFIDGLHWDGQWQSLALIALVMGLINAVVRPLAKLLSLPLVILSLGLFLLVINAAMLQLAILVTGDRFTSDGFFWSTFLGALVISIVSGVVTAVIGEDD